MSATATTADAPRRFGPYVLLRMLDGGGQGRVDLALMNDAGRARVCVIKRMLPEIAGPDARARFAHELRITKRLAHPAVVRTLAVDEIEGEPCIVQEYVEGHSLAYVMSVCGTQRRAFPAALAVHVVREVLRALAYVHAFENLGLVHRDISPANIQLAFNGDVKLLDFGVAKSDAQGFETATGMLVGRPAFVAPEVYAGKRPDGRADIYSAGVVLWGLLARRFVGDVRDGQGNLPPPSTINPDVPAELDDIVGRALAPDPAARYADAAAFAGAIDRALPSGFDGRAAVRELIGGLFDLAAERRMRGVDMGAAQAMLPAAAALPPRKRARRFVSPIGVGLLGVAAAFVIAVRHKERPSAVPSPTVAGASVSSSPAPVLEPPAALAGPPPAVVAAPPATPPPATDLTERASSSVARPKPASGPSADELTERAAAKLGEEKFAEAIKLARGALKAGGGADARVVLARALLETGRRADAERELVAATRHEPGNTAAAKFLRDVRQAKGEKP